MHCDAMRRCVAFKAQQCCEAGVTMMLPDKRKSWPEGQRRVYRVETSSRRVDGLDTQRLEVARSTTGTVTVQGSEHSTVLVLGAPSTS